EERHEVEELLETGTRDLTADAADLDRATDVPRRVPTREHSAQEIDRQHHDVPRPRTAVGERRQRLERSARHVLIEILRTDADAPVHVAIAQAHALGY